MAALKYYDASTGKWITMGYGTPETPSTSGDKTYIHKQNSAASVWVVVHNLDKYPSVTVQDSGGNLVVGSITYNSTNSLTLQFSAPFSGTAYLN
jgi:hypothetical protein